MTSEHWLWDYNKTSKHFFKKYKLPWCPVKKKTLKHDIVICKKKNFSNELANQHYYYSFPLLLCLYSYQILCEEKHLHFLYAGPKSSYRASLLCPIRFSCFVSLLMFRHPPLLVLATYDAPFSYVLTLD